MKTYNTQPLYIPEPEHILITKTPQGEKNENSRYRRQKSQPKSPKRSPTKLFGKSSTLFGDVNLLQSDISEIKTLITPPLVVVNVMACICIVLKPEMGEFVDDTKELWRKVALMMKDFNFKKNCEELMNGEGNLVYK